MTDKPEDRRERWRKKKVQVLVYLTPEQAAAVDARRAKWESRADVLKAGLDRELERRARADKG